MRLASALALSVWAGLAQASGICGAAGPGLAHDLSGTWQIQVVHSRAHGGTISLRAPLGSREQVTLALGDNATGTLTIKGIALAAHLRPAGVMAMQALPDHYRAYLNAVPHVTGPERDALVGCDIRSLPQLSAGNSTPKADTAIELIAMGPDLFIGAQVTTLHDPQLPQMRIVSALVMRRQNHAQP